MALPVQLSEQGLVYQQYSDEERKIRTERSAADYLGFDSQIKHIYALPDTYIGSMERSPRQEYLFVPATEEKGRASLRLYQVDVPEGYLHPFLEVLSNAGDNADASRRMGVNPGSISVSFDSQWVTVRSEGEPIPVEVRPDISTAEQPLTVIDFVFGRLLTSGNYDKRVISMGCGKNGYGAKLCNIFSKEFRVRVGDPKRGQEHESVWKGNMMYHVSSTSKPGWRFDPQGEGTLMGKDGFPVKGQWISAMTPENAYRGPSYVEVAWVQDFARFGYEQHPQEALGFFSRYLIDFGFTCKVPVNLGGQRYDVRSIRDYARLYWTEEECSSAITHYEWGTSDGQAPEHLRKLRGSTLDAAIAEGKTVGEIPIVEVAALDTPDASLCLSYVNGLMTPEGGVHVQEAQRVLIAEILNIVNARFGEKKSKGRSSKNSGKEDKKKEIKTPHLTPSDVKPHISLIVNCRLPDPAYNSQSKTYLNRPKPKITLHDSELKGIRDWKLIDRLVATLEAKINRTLAKTDGKKKRHVLLAQGEDANEAGGPRSSQCILILSEGNSALAYASRRRDLLGGKNYFGILPLRGKILNVTDKDRLRINENAEITNIKQMMGLTTGADYTQPGMIESLRYGFILGTLDADTDGDHIKTLLINLLYRQWPSLIQLGMFGFLQTPAVRLFKGNEIVARFSSQEEFEKWEAKNPNHGLRTKYYKGLGTSKDSDIADDIHTALTILCVYDDQTPASMDLAFRKDQADARKVWMHRMRGVTEDIVTVPLTELIHQRSITSVINRDLHRYTLDALFRGIPCYRDGLKKSQRQALYYALGKWQYGKKEKGEENIARLANMAAADVFYHHGPDSLAATIIKMTQGFVGANNLPIFRADGQTGTRARGGADASNPRYPSTGLAWWVKYVYNKELIDLVPRVRVEGQPAESMWIPCDIPYHVLNGACGIATGYSTLIPCHRPADIIRWLLERCTMEDGKGAPKPFYPWYRGFTGELKVSTYRPPPPTGGAGPTIITEDDSDGEEEEEKEEVSDDLVAVSRRTRRKGAKTLRTYGRFEILRSGAGSYDIRISELPIGRWILPYRKWIESLLADKKIKDFRDNSTTETPGFDITGFVSESRPSYPQLHLQKSFGLENMILIDEAGYPHKFKGVPEIMEAYYQSMIQIYTQLVQKRISETETELIDLSYRRRLIQLIISESEDPKERIFVLRQSRAQVLAQLDSHQIPRRFINKILLLNLTSDDIAQCDQDILGKQAELEKHKQTRPQEIWAERLRHFETELRKRDLA